MPDKLQASLLKLKPGANAINSTDMYVYKMKKHEGFHAMSLDEPWMSEI